LVYLAIPIFFYVTVSSFIKSFSHIFMPYTCFGCDNALLAHEEVLCLDCLYHLPRTDFHRDIQNDSIKQLWGKLDVVFASSMLYLSKSSSTEKLLYGLKFKGFPQIGVYLGAMYGRELGPILAHLKLDYIVPIPIHPTKLRKRGYNQALCFANGLAQSMNVPVLNNVLLRVVASQSQVTKSRAERYDNVEHVFAIADHSISLQHKHILLVDDVLTTGATIGVAGNILKKAGATVSVVTLVRA